MLFSILIANYNNSRFLLEAIKSVQQQVYTNWEIILVDDSSTDNFRDIALELLPDKRIKVYQNKINEGCGYSKRKCAELAHGELMAFLDPDDAITPDALQIMYDAHLTNPSTSLIYSTHYICDPLLRVNRIADYPKALPPDTPYLLISDGSVHAFASFKRSCYLKTEGLAAHKRKAIDQDLYYKMEETGDFLFINKPLYYYRIHEGSISTSGKEYHATLVHYEIIRESCLRRIKAFKSANTETKSFWIRKYKTRYYKISILNSFRNKEWIKFLGHLAIYPFVGGMEHVYTYCKKIPYGGLSLFRKTFAYDHKIKV